MPHLSPMQWCTLFIFSWMMLSLISTNIFFMKDKPTMTSKPTMTQINLNWKWY